MSAYQLSLLFIVGYLTFLDGIICTLPVFVNYEPVFTCETESASFSSSMLKKNKCSVHTENNTFYLEFNSTKCSKIIYDKSVQKSTLVTEFNLICDHEWLSKLSISCGMFGIAIGAFCGGYFTDKYGRKTGIYIMTILSSIVLFMQAHSPNIYAYWVRKYSICC